MPIFHSEKGQGLAEYALWLTFVSVVVIVILAILVLSIGNVFSNIVVSLDPTTSNDSTSEGGGGGSVDVVVINRADYDSPNESVHLDAISDGDYDPGVPLTALPGGVMEARAHHYHLLFNLSGCPCTVTVTSSSGGSASVTVGP